MKAALLAALLAAAAGSELSAARGSASLADPLNKVVSLLSSLEAKIIKEGEAEAKAYKEYVAWCDDATTNKGFEIKTAKAQKEDLEASIEKSTTTIGAAASAIEELAASIASGEAELTNATTIREKEHKEFVAAEAELADAISTLDRAIAIIEREMAKNPALMQMQVVSSDTKQLVHALTTIVEAAGFDLTDRRKLIGLVQDRNQESGGDEVQESAKEESDEENLGAPAPTAYKSHSEGIVDVLEDLKEKAETELSSLRKAETNAKHNFDMLKQSLEDQKAADTKDLAQEKEKSTAAAEAKASAEGDLATTVKALANAEAALATAQTTCMTVAGDHEETVKARAEELKVLAEAKNIILSSTSGAANKTYSLLQVDWKSTSSLKTGADLANAEIITIVKKLAQKYHSTLLSQLASKITAVLKFGAGQGEDPFAKVRQMIQELIDRLMKEAASEASEKAYCDDELAKTTEKKTSLNAEVDYISAKIDGAAAASTKLKEEVAELQKEIAALVKEQAEMDAYRQDEHAAYVEAKADLEEGLTGIRKALELLRNYYEAKAEALLQDREGSGDAQPPYPEKHSKSSGAGGGIIDMLEVIESDFATSLAKEETEEADAQAEYYKTTQMNKVTKAMDDQDVKHKTAEGKRLDKKLAELSSDKETASEELNAVLTYYEKLKDRCIAKAESYEERSSRREAEIAGLKQALEILEGEALVQVSRPRRAGFRLR